MTKSNDGPVLMNTGHCVVDVAVRYWKALGTSARVTFESAMEEYFQAPKDADLARWADDGGPHP